MLGTWIVYNLYPLLMKHTCGIDTGKSSLYYAIAAVIGIFFCALSGTWSTKWEADKVALLGALMTLFSIAGMALPIPAGSGLHGLLVPLIFLMLPVAWSPLIVAGTALAGDLTTIPQGTAMGLFNACTAPACVLAAILTVIALFIYLPILLRHKKSTS